MAANYPNQHFLTGNVIIADNVVDALAKRARLVTSIDTLLQQTRLVHAPRYGDTVVKVIQETVAKFPDLAKVTRETQAAEKQQKILDAAAFKELRSHLVKVFDGCYDAVYSEVETLPEDLPLGCKRKNPKRPRQRFQLFLKLPRNDFFPDYYQLIPEPISMTMIKSLSQKATHYTTLEEYCKAWHLMFDNTRRYNIDGSQVYEEPDCLQRP
ncbi:SNF2-family ATP dependent chromatin remodeling factor snf21 [Mycena venus]|uniref:SNF2-family ATP dependent chromatin remodeling factor snf21 n=1 Tax=Mycena venus TaxID=2733690 RepID=A0A8H6Z7G1_9AGAR|nr:SNF2-family ATP dependent chromatin remodeling factor snf21 [Mycena venus]